MRGGVRWGLLLALVVGFALRVYQLGGQDLWGDEGFTTYVIGLPWAQVLTPGTDTHPPLYYALLKLWAALVAPPPGLAQSEFALRFLSVVVSLLMLPLAALAASWLFGRRAGLLAAWLMATAPVHVYYAQELRMYALASLLALWSTVGLIGWLLDGRRRWLAAYALVTLLGLYTHYGVFFILPAQALAVLTSAGTRDKGLGTRDSAAAFRLPSSVLRPPSSVLRAWLGVMLLLALAYLPWVVGQARYLLGHARQNAWTWRLADLAGIAWRGLVSYTAGLTLPTGEAGAVALNVLLGLVGVAVLARQGTPAPGPSPRQGGAPSIGKGGGAVLLAAGVVSPLLVGWLANPIMPFFHERFVLMGAASLLVAVAGGLDWLWRRPWLGLVGTLLVVGVNGVALNHWYFDPQYVKSDYGQALRALYAQARPDDIILLNNTEQLPLFTFYHQAGAGRPAWAALSNDDVFTADSTDRRLSRVTAGHVRVWLINYGAKAVYDPEAHAEQWLAAHGFRALFRSQRGFEVAMYILGDGLPQTPTVAAPVQFADGVRLVGVDLQPQPAQPGASLLVTLFWQATQRPQARYTVFCHLVDAGGGLVAQFDSEPMGGTAPTTGWQANAAVVDRRAIELPPDLPAGEYTLRVGLYTWPDLTRLAVQDTALPVVDSAVAVASVEVQP